MRCAISTSPACMAARSWRSWKRQRRAVRPAFYEALLRDCEHCAGALERIEHSVDQRLGVDGPSFSAAKSGLQSLVLFVKPMVKEGGVAAGGRRRWPARRRSAGQSILRRRAGRCNRAPRPWPSCATVADFFRRTEPHSPVAYLADKAAHWGEQPLHVWLRSVVKDDASFAHIEEMLGVAPPAKG
jgi:type VI secretion system protein ImpA